MYGFVRPTTGQTYWLILPTVNTEAMNLALAEFARDLGAGSRKRLRVPEGIDTESSCILCLWHAQSSLNLI